MKVRRALVAGAGVVSMVAVGQAVNLMMHYKSPPDPSGPRWGLETYTNRRLPDLQEKGRIWVDGMSERMQNWRKNASRRDLTDGVKVRRGKEELERKGTKPPEPNDPEGWRHVGPAVRRILFIGDSLVNGVGCDGGNGPTLPRHAARFLAEKWKMDVSWRALGVTGADVRMLRKELMPRVRDEVALVNAQRLALAPPSNEAILSHPPIDAVFVVCGVNDWKKCITTGRSWRSFRRDLEELVKEIKELCGEECKVILPALPGVDFAPLFREPLRSIVRVASDCWDDQKRYLAEKLQEVIFVEKPENSFWGSGNPTRWYAKDRVHPNDQGYAKWAEYLADCITRPTAASPPGTDA